MVSNSGFKVLILMSMVMGSFCYFYIVPAELGKSKGYKNFTKIGICLWPCLFLDKDGFCFFNDTNSLIKKGESIITPQCEEVSCNDDYSMSIAGYDSLLNWNSCQQYFRPTFRCGTFSLYDPSCAKWERDFTKPYPECCTTFICVEFREKVVDSEALNKNTLD